MDKKKCRNRREIGLSTTVTNRENMVTGIFKRHDAHVTQYDPHHAQRPETVDRGYRVFADRLVTYLSQISSHRKRQQHVYGRT